MEHEQDFFGRVATLEPPDDTPEVATLDATLLLLGKLFQ